jgi:hypothetical protein
MIPSRRLGKKPHPLVRRQRDLVGAIRELAVNIARQLVRHVNDRIAVRMVDNPTAVDAHQAASLTTPSAISESQQPACSSAGPEDVVDRTNARPTQEGVAVHHDCHASNAVRCGRRSEPPGVGLGSRTVRLPRSSSCGEKGAFGGLPRHPWWRRYRGATGQRAMKLITAWRR